MSLLLATTLAEKIFRRASGSSESALTAGMTGFSVVIARIPRAKSSCSWPQLITTGIFLTGPRSITASSASAGRSSDAGFFPTTQLSRRFCLSVSVNPEY